MTLQGKVRAGLKWGAAAKLCGQLVTWVITLYVIRLLTPADYGLMAMATVVVSLVALVAEMGLGAALVQAPRIDDATIRRVFGATLLFNAALSVAVALAAPLAARFFDEPRIVAVVQVAGLQFLVNALAVVPEALLRREMLFKRLALTDMGASVAASLATVALALAGMGVWSLVLGNLVQSACRAVSLQYLSEKRYLPSFRLAGMRSALAFGGQITANRILWHALSQADILIAGKVLGKEALGIYSVTLHLATMPVQKVMSLVNQVAFPAFSEAQNDPDSLKQGVERGVRLLAVGFFPVLWGMAAVAPEIIGLVFGPEWQESSLVLQLVAAVLPFRILAAFLSTASCGIGHAGISLLNTVVSTVVMTTAFIIGVQWGLTGLAASWAVGIPLSFALNFPRLRQLLGLSLARLVQLIRLPVSAGFSMVIIVSFLRKEIGDDFDQHWRLLILVFSGAIAYMGAATICNRSIWSELRVALGGRTI